MYFNHFNSPFRFWCYKVLPLVYDESLSYYEVLCKLTKVINDIGGVTEYQNQMIQEILAKLKDLDTGFTDEQLRRILDEMVANGEFDFLVDLITAKTYLNETVGLNPYGQIIFDSLIDISTLSEWGVQSMAMGVANNVPYLFVGISRANDNNPESRAIIYNLNTGLVSNSNSTYVGTMNSCGFNDIDKCFYVASGGDATRITKFDVNANIVGYVDFNLNAGWKAGGITFNRSNGNAIIAWYSTSGSNGQIRINEVENINTLTEISVDTYVKTATYTRPTHDEYGWSVGRQDIYNDGVYLYLPTYYKMRRTVNDNSSSITVRDSRQDVLTLSNFEYICTQHFDSPLEIESGEYFNGTYYALFNCSRSGVLLKSDVRMQNVYNKTLFKTTKMKYANSNYGPLTIYCNASNRNLFADGLSQSTGFNRLMTALIFTPPCMNVGGVEYNLTGNFIHNDFTDAFIGDMKERTVFTGGIGAVLPRITFSNCDRITINNCTIENKGTGTTSLYFFDCEAVALTDVTFKNTAANVTEIKLENSHMIINDKTGHDATGTACAKTIVKSGNSTVSGKFYPDISGSDYFDASTIDFDLDGYTGNLRGIMETTGLHIFGNINTGNGYSSGAVVATFPNTKQTLSSIHLGNANAEIFAVGNDGNPYILRFYLSRNRIEAPLAIPANVNLYVNSVINTPTLNV